MSDKVRNAAWGAIVGETLGAPIAGRKTLTKLSFYEPVPKRMAPSRPLDSWILLAGQPSEFENLGRGNCSNMPGGGPEGAVARANAERGLFGSVAGSFANPFAQCSGAIGRAVFWGLKLPNNPQFAAQMAAYDACTDHSQDGVWCASALAAGISVAEQGVTFAQVVSAMTATLPKSSIVQKGISLVLQSMGQPDSIRLVHAKIANVFGTIDPNHAAIALTYALAGIGMSKDFESAVTTAVGCGGPATDVGLVTGALASIIYGGVPAEWSNVLGADFVSGFLPATVDVPSTIDEFSELVSKAVIPPTVPLEPNPSETTSPESVEPTEPAPPLPYVPTPPGPPTGNTLFWIRGFLQCEVEYLSGPVALDGQSIQMSVTFRNFGSEAVDVTASFDMPDGWKSATHLSSLRVVPSEPSSHAVVFQSPVLFEDSSVTLRVNKEEFKIPVLAPSRWFFAGPFANEDQSAFERDVPAERAPKVSDHFSGRSGFKVVWEPLLVTSDRIDVEPLFKSGPGVVVLYGKFQFPVASLYSVLAAGSPGVVVKIDGQSIVKYKDAHVPIPRLSPPYFGEFEASEQTTIVIKLIRDQGPASELTFMFFDRDGNVVTPHSVGQMPE